MRRPVRGEKMRAMPPVLRGATSRFPMGQGGLARASSWLRERSGGVKGEDATLTQAVRRGPSFRQYLQRLMVATFVGVALDVTNAVLSLLTVVIYVAGTYLPEVDWEMDALRTSEEWWALVLNEVEFWVAVYLAFDYLFRTYLSSPPYKYTFSWMGLLDLITILPIFLTYRQRLLSADPTIVIAIQVGEILRILRVFRIFRLAPYIESVVTRQMVRIGTIVFSVVIVSAATFHLLEGVYGDTGNNLPFHDWFYFICISITTVGYGDIEPSLVITKMLVISVVAFSFIQIPIETNRLIRIMTEQSEYALATYRPPQKKREVEHADWWNVEDSEYAMDESYETDSGSEESEENELGRRDSDERDGDEGSEDNERRRMARWGTVEEEEMRRGGCCGGCCWWCWEVGQAVKDECGACAAACRSSRNHDRFVQVIVTGHVDAAATSGFIHELLHEDHGSQMMHIVVLSPLPPSPYMEELLADPELGPHLFYIQGSPVHEKDLKRASVSTAQGVFVLVDKFAPHPAAEDASSMLTALSIKRHCAAKAKRDVPMFLQLTRVQSKAHLMAVLPREMRMTVVCTEQLTHSLLALNATTPGIVTLLGNLISSADVESVDREADPATEEYLAGMDFEIYRVPLAGAYAGVPFQVAAAIVYEETSTLMFGLELTDEEEGNIDVVGLLSAERSRPGVSEEDDVWEKVTSIAAVIPKTPRLILNPGHFRIPDVAGVSVKAFIIAKDKITADLVGLSQSALNSPALTVEARRSIRRLQRRLTAVRRDVTQQLQARSVARRAAHQQEIHRMKQRLARLGLATKIFNRPLNRQPKRPQMASTRHLGSDFTPRDEEEERESNSELHPTAGRRSSMPTRLEDRRAFDEELGVKREDFVKRKKDTKGAGVGDGSRKEEDDVGHGTGSGEEGDEGDGSESGWSGGGSGSGSSWIGKKTVAPPTSPPSSSAPSPPPRRSPLPATTTPPPPFPRTLHVEVRSPTEEGKKEGSGDGSESKKDVDWTIPPPSPARSNMGHVLTSSPSSQSSTGRPRRGSEGDMSIRLLSARHRAIRLCTTALVVDRLAAGKIKQDDLPHISSSPSSSSSLPTLISQLVVREDGEGREGGKGTVGRLCRPRRHSLEVSVLGRGGIDEGGVGREEGRMAGDMEDDEEADGDGDREERKEKGLGGVGRMELEQMHRDAGKELAAGTVTLWDEIVVLGGATHHRPWIQSEGEEGGGEGGNSDPKPHTSHRSSLLRTSTRALFDSTFPSSPFASVDWEKVIHAAVVANGGVWKDGSWDEMCAASASLQVHFAPPPSPALSPGMYISLEEVKPKPKRRSREEREQQRRARHSTSSHSSMERDFTSRTVEGEIPSRERMDHLWRRLRRRVKVMASVGSALKSVSGPARQRRKFYLRGVPLSLGQATVLPGRSVPASMSGHVVVIGRPGGWPLLLRHLRSRKLALARPVVLVSPADPTIEEWESVGGYADVHFLRGSAMNPEDLKRAAIERAANVIVLGRHGKYVGTIGEGFEGISSAARFAAAESNSIGGIRPLLVADAEALFTSQSCVGVAPDISITTELLSFSNAVFLRPHPRTFRQNAVLEANSSTSYNAVLSPEYMGGGVFTPAMLDILLSSAFYNPAIVKLVETIADCAEKTQRSKAGGERRPAPLPRIPTRSFARSMGNNSPTGRSGRFSPGSPPSLIRHKTKGSAARPRQLSSTSVLGSASGSMKYAASGAVLASRSSSKRRPPPSPSARRSRRRSIVEILGVGVAPEDRNDLLGGMLGGEVDATDLDASSGDPPPSSTAPKAAGSPPGPGVLQVTPSVSDLDLVRVLRASDLATTSLANQPPISRTSPASQPKTSPPHPRAPRRSILKGGNRRGSAPGPFPLEPGMSTLHRSSLKVTDAAREAIEALSGGKKGGEGEEKKGEGHRGPGGRPIRKKVTAYESDEEDAKADTSRLGRLTRSLKPSRIACIPIPRSAPMRYGALVALLFVEKGLAPIGLLRIKPGMVVQNGPESVWWFDSSATAQSTTSLRQSLLRKLPRPPPAHAAYVVCNPPPELRLRHSDRIYVIGPPHALEPYLID